MKRAFALLLALALGACLRVPALAADETPLLILDNPQTAYVVDEADLLTEEEETELETLAEEISRRQECDVVLVTANTLNGATPMDYADDYFDYNGYGYGPDRTGLLLLISMEERDWWISTRGEAIQAFTDTGIQYLGDKFLSSLSYGDYEDAFAAYFETADQMLSIYRGTLSDQEAEAYNQDFQDFEEEYYGEDWEDNREMEGAGHGLLRIILTAVIALAGPIIPISAQVAQIKNVRKKDNAASYLQRDSLRLNRNRDVYLYANTTSRVIETNRSSGGHGGSSVHISSSGASHGGGGGKF